jgi:hypothetical protein
LCMKKDTRVAVLLSDAEAPMIEAVIRARESASAMFRRLLAEEFERQRAQRGVVG